MTSTTTSAYRPSLWLFFLLTICSTIIFTSCGPGEKEKRQKELDDFNKYVQDRRDSLEIYADRNWDELNAGYEERKVKFEKEVDKMDEEARRSYDKAVADWEAFKADYARKNEENARVAAMDKLRATLAIEGVRPDYTDLAPKDALRQYEHFVNTVRTNKDAYTQEQWTVINVNYKALNGRKRQIDGEIPSADLGKITKLQLEYTGIKAVNRPFAEDTE